jgi:hypothetical protein
VIGAPFIGAEMGARYGDRTGTVGTIGRESGDRALRESTVLELSS